ncbi:MAG TPA: hypothetical protein VLC92_14535 [Rhodocyclaceae bacterium]|nr:hypothetical protein [Rhodocyclaceae bacterium]
MIATLARIIFFGVGVAVLLEAWLPETVETSRVTQHQTSTSRNIGKISSEQTSYTLALGGGQIDYCGVNEAAYTRLKDGDIVEVRASPLLRSCVHISRGSEVFMTSNTTGINAIIGGILLIALALIWPKFQHSEDETV